jgi:hypothetical protein
VLSEAEGDAGAVCGSSRAGARLRHSKPGRGSEIVPVAWNVVVGSEKTPSLLGGAEVGAGARPFLLVGRGLLPLTGNGHPEVLCCEVPAEDEVASGMIYDPSPPRDAADKTIIGASYE